MSRKRYSAIAAVGLYGLREFPLCELVASYNLGNPLLPLLWRIGLGGFECMGEISGRLSQVRLRLVDCSASS